MTKQEIRKHYLNLRQVLTDLDYNQRCQNLCSTFFLNVDLSAVTTLHVFLPIISKKEPDTWPIIDRLAKDYPRIRISVPKVKENSLINFYFEGKEQLKENKWNISEPQFGEITDADKIDLVIVPLLAFDLKGNRVGYGKGYYDRFLKECRPDCKKIGLSFFDPIKEITDVNVFDINLNAVITPAQAFQLN